MTTQNYLEASQKLNTFSEIVKGEIKENCLVVKIEGETFLFKKGTRLTITEKAIIVHDNKKSIVLR